jgi:hypothetical protein
MGDHTGGKGDAARKELVCGATAGVANVLSGYPFDTVKVRLQTEPGTYTGLWDCLTRIWRQEGVGAWGAGPGLWMVAEHEHTASSPSTQPGGAAACLPAHHEQAAPWFLTRW